MRYGYRCIITDDDVLFLYLFRYCFFIFKLGKVIRWTISKISIIFFSLCFDQLNWSIYCADCLKCDSIVPLDDGEILGFFGEIFFWVGCKRLRSFRKSGKKIKTNFIVNYDCRKNYKNGYLKLGTYSKCSTKREKKRTYDEWLVHHFQ